MVRRRQFLTDALVAAAFVVWVVGEVAVGAVSGPGWQNVVAGLVATVPLAWRRTFPEICGLVCAAGVTVKTGLGLNMDGMALLTAVFFASYSVGRRVPPRRALTVVAAMVALVWAALWRVPDTGPYDWVFALMWIGGPGVAATLLQHQLSRAAQLADRAARAELEQEDHARAAVAEERLRIARELHDTVAHAVSVMVLHTGAVRSRLPEGLGSERAALGDVEDTGRRAIAELRRLLGVLRSDAGDAAVAAPQPTLAELDRLVDETRRLGLRVDVEIAGDKPPLEPAVEVSAYRILQEALTNVRKHAGAQAVAVRLGYDDGCVRLRVADDGRGAVGAGAGAGHGLVGIRERAEVYGGRVSTRSPAGGGFVLEVELPVAAR